MRAVFDCTRDRMQKLTVRIAVGEFVTQLFSDVLRGVGVGAPWLVICRICKPCCRSNPIDIHTCRPTPLIVFG